MSRAVAVCVVAVACGALAQSCEGADFFVDASVGSDSADGLAWSSPFRTVGAALAAAAATAETDVVRVAAGVYAERIEVAGAVQVIGGFPSGGPTSARDVLRHVTVLDGGGVGPVVRFVAGSDGATLDGLTVRNGSTADPGSAGGIAIEGPSVTIVDSTVEGCTGPMAAAVMARWTSAAPRVHACAFRRNHVTGVWGPPNPGIVAFEGPRSGPRAEVLTDSLLEGNTSPVPLRHPQGAAVVLVGASAMRGCIVRGNMAIGAWLWNTTDVAITDSALLDNAGVAVVGQCPGRYGIENCTFAGNSFGSTHMYPWIIETAGGFDIARSITVDPDVFSLQAGPFGLEFPCISGLGAPTSVRDSIVRGGWPGGTNVLDVDPQLVPGPTSRAYLAQPPAQGSTSPAVDGGPEGAAALGLDCKVTSVAHDLDAGIVDWGAHFNRDARVIGSVPCALPSWLVTKGTSPNVLPPVATVSGLPWSDVPGSLDDGLPLAFYRVEWPAGHVRVEKDTAANAVRLHF